MGRCDWYELDGTKKFVINNHMIPMPGSEIINHGTTEQFDELASVLSHNVGFYLRETGDFSQYTHGDILQMLSNTIIDMFGDYILGCNYESWFKGKKIIDHKWEDIIEPGTRIEIRIALCNNETARCFFLFFCFFVFFFFVFFFRFLVFTHFLHFVFFFAFLRNK